jgi:hypothetical protein
MQHHGTSDYKRKLEHVQPIGISHAMVVELSTKHFAIQKSKRYSWYKHFAIQKSKRYT